MPRVALRIPSHLLKLVDEVAKRKTLSRDDLYAVAISDYLRINEPRDRPEVRGASRRVWEGRAMPKVAINLSDEHLRRAGKLATRFDRPREMLIAEAAAEYVHRDDRQYNSAHRFYSEPPAEAPRGSTES